MLIIFGDSQEKFPGVAMSWKMLIKGAGPQQKSKPDIGNASPSTHWNITQFMDPGYFKPGILVQHK
jgi:hypothetical protein